MRNIKQNIIFFCNMFPKIIKQLDTNKMYDMGKKFGGTEGIFVKSF